MRSTALSLELLTVVPVPPASLDRVRDILKRVKWDSVVAAVINNISTAQLGKDVRFLSGQEPAYEIISRNSFSQGALDAADWLKARFEETGATCDLSRFLPGFAPNIIW